MFPKDEFKKYATQHLGMSTMHLEKYMAASVPNITGFTPQVIEERQMNIVGMDVFSRLLFCSRTAQPRVMSFSVNPLWCCHSTVELLWQFWVEAIYIVL